MTTKRWLLLATSATVAVAGAFGAYAQSKAPQLQRITVYACIDPWTRELGSLRLEPERCESGGIVIRAEGQVYAARRSTISP